MRKYCTRIILIFCVLCATFTINKCYAISSREEVEYFREYKDKEFSKELKKEGYKYGRWHVAGGEITTDDIKSLFISNSMSNDESEYLLNDIIEEIFKKYFDKYLTEEVSDEERLNDYIISNTFIYTKKENYQDGDDIEADLRVYVFPASENSTWSQDKQILKCEYYDKEQEEKLCLEGYLTEKYYIRLSKENDEYVIKFMDSLPEGFHEFVEKIKTEVGLDLENINYADFINAKSQTEIIAESVETENLNSSLTVSQEESTIKDRVSLVIIITCGILIFAIVSSYFRYLNKIKKQ